jgi:probable phosphoglycerate mutase
MRRAIAERALNSLFLASGGATELLLIRHAETGCVDADDATLSAMGRQQACHLADELAYQGISAVYSAATAPAVETARVIADASSMALAPVGELGPVGMDLMDGSPLWAEVDSGLAVEMAAERLCCYPRWDALPGFENSRTFRRRVVMAIEQIAARHCGGRIAIVTHACVINAYLSMVLDIPRDFFFAPVPASVSCVRIDGDRYGVCYLNCDRPISSTQRWLVPAFTGR